VNETAAEVDRRYIERSGATGVYPLMYYSHNLHFVSYSRMMQGKFEEARDWARRLRKNVDGGIDGMPMIAPYGAFEWLVLTRFGKWDAMLAEPEPREKSAFLHAMYRYARGVALAGKRQVKGAQAERERMEAIARRVDEAEMLMNNSSRSVLAVGLADLDARISRARGEMEAEIAHWRRAVALQDKLNYMEPPEWHYSVREALGGALLRDGNAEEAEAVFREDLKRHPRNGRSLFGLLEALQMGRKAVGVEWVRKEFAEAWRYSPVSLTAGEL
jgi:tetratricopeptide (TPR) repeat protein